MWLDLATAGSDVRSLLLPLLFDCTAFADACADEMSAGMGGCVSVPDSRSAFLSGSVQPGGTLWTFSVASVRLFCSILYSDFGSCRSRGSPLHPSPLVGCWSLTLPCCFPLRQSAEPPSCKGLTMDYGAGIFNHTADLAGIRPRLLSHFPWTGPFCPARPAAVISFLPLRPSRATSPRSVSFFAVA